MSGHSHGSFSVSVNFVFVSPDGSAIRNRSGKQRRVAFIHLCLPGCDEERLPEANTKGKGAQEKMTMKEHT